jgi:hypothetical protein
MPNKVKQKNISFDTVSVLNATRNGASPYYQNSVPVAVPRDIERLRMIGDIITGDEIIKNEFLSSLWNRIGKTYIKNKIYNNPWSFMKQGELMLGEIIQEIFVELAKPFQYDPAVAESELQKREKPDVRAAYHIMNYQKFYKATTSDADLKQAFISWDGLYSLVGKITESLYTGANYDEFLTMKYMIAREILDGMLPTHAIGAVSTADEMSEAMVQVKALSDSLTFLSPDYNRAGVHNFTLKDDQYLLVSTAFNARMDVQSLATAFNMDKVEFLGHVVLVDSFGKLDTARLGELFAGDPTYKEIGQDDLDKLAAVPAVLVSRDYLMVFDNLNEFRTRDNEQGLYRNHWFHVWRTFSASPFENAVLLQADAPTVTAVTVTPATATLPVGGSVKLSVAVTGTNFPPAGVTWQSDNENVTVDGNGNVKVLTGATGTATITATSVYDTTKTGKSTITVE